MRKVGGHDFKKTTRSWREAEEVKRWAVYTQYESRPSRRRALDGYFQTTRRPGEYHLAAASDPYGALTNDTNWTKYKPLETPDLFLEFARLAKHPTSDERALSWAHRYGVLGLAGDHHSGWYGGEGESVTAFDEQVVRAAGILSLYEAVLNKDADSAARLILEEYPSLSAETLGAITASGRVDKKSIMHIVDEGFGGDYLAYALETACWLVETTVRTYCYPTLRPEGASDPSALGNSWGFKTLLGAMYLQMYWLIAAGGDVVRCKYCSDIITLDRPAIGVRKPPKHKLFCSNACRQSDYYRRKTKPRRQQRGA